MDDDFRVVKRGRVYIDQGCIVAVQDATQPPPAGFEATAVVDVGGTIFPGIDRAPQSPRVQRAAAVARAAALHESRAVGRNARVPEAGHGTDESHRAHRDRHAGARSLCRMQVSRRRCDDEPGDRALQQRRSAALLSRRRAERRADGPGRPSRSGHAHCRCRRQESRAIPRAIEEADVPAAALERGRGSDGTTALPRLEAAERRMGDYKSARRHSLRRVAERRLQDLRRQRRLDGVVADEQPVALRCDVAGEVGSRQRRPDRPRI